MGKRTFFLVIALGVSIDQDKKPEEIVKNLQGFEKDKLSFLDGGIMAWPYEVK